MELYQYFIEWTMMFSCLNAWQRRGLALWCSGVVAAGKCQITAVADTLVSDATPSSDALARRLDRFLSNPRISDELLLKGWLQWIVKVYPGNHWVILVDETKLGPHLSVMMVGLAYKRRAIPLIWRCYRPKAYPEEGQVKLIMDLLNRLRLLIPDTIAFTVQADRGIGTSPGLIRQLQAGGMMYLLRVQGGVKLRLDNGKEHQLKALVKPGECWAGYAQVFKKAGWLRLYVRLDWRLGEKAPWCLVTNCGWRESKDYRQRAWQEQSFRDLKSFGFNWQQSHIWTPERANRLMFVLALAYCWVLSQAELWTQPETLSPSRQHPRQSIFRRGLRWVRQQMRLTHSKLSPTFFLVPERPLLC